MKRIVPLLVLASLVCTLFLVPVGAVDENSNSYSGASLVNLMSLSPNSAYCGVQLIDRSDETDYAPEMSFYKIRPDSGLTTQFSKSGASVSVSMPNTMISAVNDDIISYVGLATYADNSIFGNSSLVIMDTQHIELRIDLSSFSDITDIEFLGSVSLSTDYTEGMFTQNRTGGTCSLYVNDVFTEVEFSATSGVIQFDNYLYSSDVPITSLSLRFSPSLYNYSYTASNINFSWETTFDFSNATFNFLTDTGSGSGVDPNFGDRNEEFNQGIEDSESIEQEWTGSLSDAWAQTGIDDFAFDAGYTSAFMWVSSWFSTFFNAFGSYAQILLFPAIVGLCMLLLGMFRSGRLGGRGSSGPRGTPVDVPNGEYHRYDPW